jgi:hypothetical protein
LVAFLGCLALTVRMRTSRVEDETWMESYEMGMQATRGEEIR